MGVELRGEPSFITRSGLGNPDPVKQNSLVWSSLDFFLWRDLPIAGPGSQGLFWGDFGCKSGQDLMADCYENIVDINVLMRVCFSIFFMSWT